MKTRNIPFVLLFLIFVESIAIQLCAKSPDSAAAGVLPLHDGWTLQSSGKIAESGEVLSSKAFHPQGWYKTTVPSTVLAAQVASGEFPDPYFGMNLRKIPGTTYPIGRLFSNLPMDKNSPYARSWWYRTEFQLPTRIYRPDRLATFSGHQLSSEHLVERAQARRRQGCCRRLSDLRVQCELHSCFQEKPMSWLWKRSLPPRRNLASTGWTGTQRPQTRTWGFGGT